MMNFVNKLELSDEKYQASVNVIDGNHKGGLLLQTTKIGWAITRVDQDRFKVSGDIILL